jgi:transposase
MANYTTGFKSRMVQRMAGSEGISASALSGDVGVSQGTLSRWLREASTLGPMSKKNKKVAGTRRRRTADDKFRIVLEAASLSDEALGEYLRREGVLTAELEEWREKATAGGTSALKDAKRKKSETTPEARRIRELERELLRKDKALAETAALLVLQKKVQEFWAERDGDTNTRSET